MHKQKHFSPICWRTKTKTNPFRYAWCKRQILPVFISFFVEYWFQKIWSDWDKNLDSSLGMSEARKSKNFVTLILKSFKKWRLNDMHSVWTDGGIKSCPNFHKKLHCFWMKTLLSKISKRVDKFLGYFCWKICCKELSKFLQSGPTACIT